MLYLVLKAVHAAGVVLLPGNIVTGADSTHLDRPTPAITGPTPGSPRSAAVPRGLGEGGCWLRSKLAPGWPATKN